MNGRRPPDDDDFDGATASIPIELARSLLAQVAATGDEAPTIPTTRAASSGDDDMTAPVPRDLARLLVASTRAPDDDDATASVPMDLAKNPGGLRPRSPSPDEPETVMDLSAQFITPLAPAPAPPSPDEPATVMDLSAQFMTPLPPVVVVAPPPAPPVIPVQPLVPVAPPPPPPSRPLTGGFEQVPRGGVEASSAPSSPRRQGLMVTSPGRGRSGLMVTPSSPSSPAPSPPVLPSSPAMPAPTPTPPEVSSPSPVNATVAAALASLKPAAPASSSSSAASSSSSSPPPARVPSVAPPPRPTTGPAPLPRAPTAPPRLVTALGGDVSGPASFDTRPLTIGAAALVAVALVVVAFTGGGPAVESLPPIHLPVDAVACRRVESSGRDLICVATSPELNGLPAVEREKRLALTARLAKAGGFERVVFRESPERVWRVLDLRVAPATTTAATTATPKVPMTTAPTTTAPKTTAPKTTPPPKR